MQIASVSSTASSAAPASGAPADDAASGAGFADMLSGAYRSRLGRAPEPKSIEIPAARSTERSDQSDRARGDRSRTAEQAADRGNDRDRASAADSSESRSSEVRAEKDAARDRMTAAKQREATGAQKAPSQAGDAASDADTDTRAETAGADAAAGAATAAKDSDGAAPAEAADETKSEAADTETVIDPLLLATLPALAVAVAQAVGQAMNPATGTVSAQPGDSLPAASAAALTPVAPEALTPEMAQAAMDAARAAAQAAALDGKTARVSVQAAADGAAPKSLVDTAALFADLIGQHGMEAELPDGILPDGVLSGTENPHADPALNFAALVRPMEQAPLHIIAQTADDAGQGIAAVGGAQAASGPAAAQHLAQNQAARHPQALVPPGEQVAVQIRKAAAEGQDTISIKLDPGNLGKVEVTLEVSGDGRLLAVIAADRPETLAMLQKDAASLEQNLRNSGLNANSDSLSFMLREQGREGGQQGDGRRRGQNGPDGGEGGPAVTDARAAQAASNARLAAARGGLDIRI